MNTLRHISNGKIVTPNARVETTRGIAGIYRGMANGNVLVAFPAPEGSNEPIIESFPPKKLNLVICN